MKTSDENRDEEQRSMPDAPALQAIAALASELGVVHAAEPRFRSRYLAGLGLNAKQVHYVNEIIDRLKDVRAERIDPSSFFGGIFDDGDHGVCPITWQPSISKPVFYGHRDFTPADGAPADVRVFYPSLEGSPEDAPMLTGCGHYPLILFLHGHCQQDVDDYLAWYRLPAALARCGYIVAVPRLADIAGGTAPWTDPNADLIFAHRTHVWIREHPEITIHLAHFPQTGIIGHSYGGMLGARLATYSPCWAYASLSAGWGEWADAGEPIPLGSLDVPTLTMWGDPGTIGEVHAVLEGGLQFIWDGIPEPKHKIAFAGAEHWDYLAEAESECVISAGPCNLTKALAADFACAFFSKYMPPEHWSSLKTRIPDSLYAALPSDLTFEEAFYEGGHLMGFKMLPFSDDCSVESSWEKSSSSGSESRERRPQRPRERVP
jgi:hypothetical protein